MGDVQIPLWSMNTIPNIPEIDYFPGSDSSMVDEYPMGKPSLCLRVSGSDSSMVDEYSGRWP